MSRKRKKLRGTVQKIITPCTPNQPEKAQIDIHGADDLYREIRIDNEVIDENGEKAIHVSSILSCLTDQRRFQRGH